MPPPADFFFESEDSYFHSVEKVSFVKGSGRVIPPTFLSVESSSDIAVPFPAAGSSISSYSIVLLPVCRDSGLGLTKFLTNFYLEFSMKNVISENR